MPTAIIIAHARRQVSSLIPLSLIREDDIGASGTEN